MAALVPVIEYEVRRKRPEISVGDTMKEQIYIAYAREDISTVRKLHRLLRERGFRVWFDDVDLRPGRWKPQLLKAINNSRVFLFCASAAALRKADDAPGFVDEELNEAHNIAMSVAERDFTILPVRLEDCGRGDGRLARFQQYDLFPQIEFETKLAALVSKLNTILRGQPGGQDNPLITKGHLELLASNPSRALTLAEQVLADDPRSASAYHLRACIYESKVDLEGDPKATLLDPNLRAALQDYTTSCILDTTNPVAYNNRGFLHLRTLALDLASQDFAKSIQLHLECARLPIDRGHLLSVEAHIRQHGIGGLGIDPEVAYVYHNQAMAFVLRRKMDEALNSWAVAIAINDAYAPFYKARGDLHYSQGRLEEAIADFGQAIKRDSKLRDAYFQRALAREDSGDLDGALSDYTDALRLRPSAVVYCNRAMVQANRGDYEGAVEDCQSAVELDPDDPQASQLLDQLITFKILKGQFGDKIKLGFNYQKP